MFKRCVSTLAVVFALLLFCACNDDSSGDNDVTEYNPTDFATRATVDYLGYDFAFAKQYTADGTTDSDGDGGIDINDAAIIIETLKNLGFDVPETTLNGLYENYYTEAGYNFQEEANYDKKAFDYTISHEIGETELKAGDFTGLEPGDLIFVDYDKDFVWDNAAIYLGKYEEKTHAALLASDYYDKVWVADLEDSEEMMVQDIQYGYSDVRKLNKSIIESGAAR